VAAVLTFIGQLGVALGFSGAIAFWIGPKAYLVVTIAVFVICLVILTEAARRDVEAQAALDVESQSSLAIAFGVFIAATVFAVIWPALAPILVWGRWRRLHQVP
jgi:hypothetical protein